MSKDKTAVKRRYSVYEVARERFYQMPKFLFEGELKRLSNDARVLYSLLKERHELSLKNQWVNDKGEVYLIYTREDMQEMLGVSEKTALKAVKQLKEHTLIQEERRGLGKPNLIFLLHYSGHNTFFKPVKNAGQEKENLPVRPGKFTGHDPENLRRNYNDLKELDLNEPNQSINQSHRADRETR